MSTPLLELLPEFLELLFFGVGGVALSVAGAFIERAALVRFAGGQTKLGVWIAFMGVMAFYFAYLLGTDKFGPKMVAFRRARSER